MKAISKINLVTKVFFSQELKKNILFTEFLPFSVTIPFMRRWERIIVFILQKSKTKEKLKTTAKKNYKKEKKIKNKNILGKKRYIIYQCNNFILLTVFSN